MSGESSACRMFLLWAPTEVLARRHHSFCMEWVEGFSFPGKCSRSGHMQVSGAADLANSSVKPDPVCDIVKNLVHNCNYLKPSFVSCLDVRAICTEMCGVITMLFFPFWNVPETSVLTHCFSSCYYTHHTWIKDREKRMFHLRRHFFFKIH